MLSITKYADENNINLKSFKRTKFNDILPGDKIIVFRKSNKSINAHTQGFFVGTKKTNKRIMIMKSSVMANTVYAYNKLGCIFFRQVRIDELYECIESMTSQINRLTGNKR